MFISQFKDSGGKIAVAVREGSEAAVVNGAASTYALAQEAAQSGKPLRAVVMAHELGAAVDLAALADAGRMVLPITHPDPAHMHLTGTGLTHLGSAAARDAMHTKLQSAELSDSMKMFQMGLSGGKPGAGGIGAQSEWFYKGNGHNAVAPSAPLNAPNFALDGGEEPEIAGIYLIDAAGTPCRIGWAVANEFSDHVTERINYLYLAHSKLRPASFGPEILIGELPDDIRGHSRILRAGSVVWEKPFLSGAANMSHSFANLEHHHFKYDVFCQPNDVHVHMFGTATLSFADNFAAETGDVFEINAPQLGLPLRNPLGRDTDKGMITVKAL